MSSADALRGMPSVLRLAYRSALLGLIATLVLAGFTGGVAADIARHSGSAGQLAGREFADRQSLDGELADGEFTNARRVAPGSSQFAADQPDGGQLADGLITDGLITDGLITDGLITDGLITDIPLADGLIAAGPLADGLIADGLIADGSLAAGSLGDRGSSAQPGQDAPRPDGADANGHQPLTGRLTQTTTPVLLSKRAGGRAIQPGPAAALLNGAADTSVTAFTLVAPSVDAADLVAVRTQRGRGPPARSLS